MKITIQNLITSQTAMRELTNLSAKDLPSADFGMRIFRAARSIKGGLAAYNDYCESAQKRVDSLLKSGLDKGALKVQVKVLTDDENRIIKEMATGETEINPPTFTLEELGYGSEGKPLISVACLLDLQSTGIVVEG